MCSSTTLQWQMFHIKIFHFIFAENQNEFMSIDSKKNARTVDIGFKQSCWEGRSLLNRANVCWHWSTFWKSQLSSSQHFLLHQSWKMLFLMVILKFLTVGWLLGDSLMTAWHQLVSMLGIGWWVIKDDSLQTAYIGLARASWIAVWLHRVTVFWWHTESFYFNNNDCGVGVCHL